MTTKVIYQNLTNQKEENQMVTNFNELTQEEVMSNPSLQNLVYEEIGRTSQYKYHLGNLVGFQNIEEKGKWKEAMMGTVLDQRVFTGSTGEDKGADAVDMPGTTKPWNDGSSSEYKTQELLDEKQLNRFLDSVVSGTKTFAGSMTYNNGYSRENVESYLEYNHYHGVFYRGHLVCVTKVDTDYVCGDTGLMKRVLLAEGGKEYASTNGNGVSPHYENGGVREGEIIYLNDIRE